MSEFIRPRFQQTVTYEALLTRTEVEQYATANNIGFDEAAEVLGRTYISKYGKYNIIAGTPLKMIASDSE